MMQGIDSVILLLFKEIIFQINIIVMKKIITTSVFLIAVTLCFAQQEQQYTQFMYNKLAINPGYAGSHDAGCFTALYRNQWIGLEGAPKTQMLSFDTPLLHNRIGVGLNLTRTTIGITEKWTADGSYAYRVALGRGTLGLGVQASIRYFGNDYTDSRLVATQAISSDGGIPVGDQSKYVPNFGAGLYYSTENYYFGISAPRFLKNNIDFNSLSGVLGREVPHLFFMTGLLWKISETAKLQPQALFKYADNSPFDADFNLNLILQDKYTVGVTYRVGGSSLTGIGESLDFLVAAHLNANLLFGLSYDITLSEIKDYNSGSIEVILRYCLASPEGEDVI